MSSDGGTKRPPSKKKRPGKKKRAGAALADLQQRNPMTPREQRALTAELQQRVDFHASDAKVLGVDFGGVSFCVTPSYDAEARLLHYAIAGHD